jgi:plastocyanin
MRTRYAVAIGASIMALVASTLGVGAALAGGASPSDPIGGGASVSTFGDTTFEPNALVQSTLHFSPYKTVADHGQQVRWVHRDGDQDPHTVTIVRRSDLPTSADEVFNCKVCNKALRAHFAGGFHRKVDVGQPGVDEPGDSLVLFPDQPVTGTITADPGEHLYYLCAIHPWMQGRIVVQG